MLKSLVKWPRGNYNFKTKQSFEYKHGWFNADVSAVNGVSGSKHWFWRRLDYYTDLAPWQCMPRWQGSWGQHGAIWGRQDPGGPHVGPVNFTIWVYMWLSVKRAYPRKLTFTKRPCVFTCAWNIVFEHKINFFVDVVSMVCFVCVWLCFACVSFEFTLGSCVFNLSLRCYRAHGEPKKAHREQKNNITVTS